MMSITKLASGFVMLAALLNVSGCCQDGCLVQKIDDNKPMCCQGNDCVAQSQLDNCKNKVRVVNFAFNSAELTRDDLEILAAQIPALQKNSSLRLQVEGHTDERGTDEYNLALGKRRAKAVAKVLEREGVSSDRIDIVSYGKKKPLVHALNDKANAQNRRVELKVS